MPATSAGRDGRARRGGSAGYLALCAARGSGAEVDSHVPAGKGRRADLGEAVEPCRLVRAGSASEPRSVGGEAVIGGAVALGAFGVDGSLAGAGAQVRDVPWEALAALGTESLSGLVAPGALGFGFAYFGRGAP